MASTYKRITRPIGNHSRPKPQPPKIDTSPKIANLIFTVLTDIKLKNIQSAFFSIKYYGSRKKTLLHLKKAALAKLLDKITAIRERLKLQSIFLIRNFIPTQVKSNFDQINWHRDKNQREPLDPKNPLLTGIAYCPFKRMTKKQSIKKHVLFAERSSQLLNVIIKKILLKPIHKGFQSMKFKAVMLNMPFQKGVLILERITNHALLVSFSKIKYSNNRLFIKSRKDIDHKFRTLSSLKQEMTIEAERRNIIKTGIDKEREYRNQIIVPRQRALQQQIADLQDYYQEESLILRSEIYKKQIYIENIFLSPDLYDMVLQTQNYFQKLQTIYIDLNQSEKATIQKRSFIKKYQLEQASGNLKLVLQNINLWQNVKRYQQSSSIPVSHDFKFQLQYKTMQQQLFQQNNRMKKVIAFYVREDYGKNLKKQARLLQNLKSELEQMEQKLKQNKIEEVRMMFA